MYKFHTLAGLLCTRLKSDRFNIIWKAFIIQMKSSLLVRLSWDLQVPALTHGRYLETIMII